MVIVNERWNMVMVKVENRKEGASQMKEPTMLRWASLCTVGLCLEDKHDKVPLYFQRGELVQTHD